MSKKNYWRGFDLDSGPDLLVLVVTVLLAIGATLFVLQGLGVLR